jgi:L-threonylcarbamoyladenylate synthase
MLPLHYAPSIPLFLVSAPLSSPYSDTFVIRIGAKEVWREGEITLQEDPQAFAKKLYAALRAAESSGAARIFLTAPPSGEEWSAINDRLRRASAPRS